MKYISKNEFLEITCSASGDVINLFWSKNSRHMSEWEFIEQVDTLFSAAEIFKSKVLYIDAFEFCYHSNDKLIQQIKEQLDRCNIKLIGIVMSSNRLGKLYVLKLLKNISLTGITLTIFKTKKEGEFWVSLRDSLIHY